jgi:hypothetical protein
MQRSQDYPWVSFVTSLSINAVLLSDTSLVTGFADAIRPFGLLPGCIRADCRTLNDFGSLDDQLAAARYFYCEAIHTAWRWATTLLANAIVLGAVARTLEPL